MTPTSNGVNKLLRKEVAPITMMRKTLFIVGLLLLSNVAFAETEYVIDKIVITLRSGQSNQHQILRTLPSGTPMEILERGEKYSKARLKDGTEGWVLNQYITAIPIAKYRLAVAKKKLAAAESENTHLKKELASTREKENTLGEQFANLQKADKKVSKELDQLRRVAAKPLQLENENMRMKKELLDLENEHELVRQENQILRDSTDREWFLTGAGVIILGIILGLIAPSLRPRKKSSWGSL